MCRDRRCKHYWALQRAKMFMRTHSKALGGLKICMLFIAKNDSGDERKQNQSTKQYHLGWFLALYACYDWFKRKF